MTKSFEERNQTDTARRKLKSLAISNDVDLELVSTLANFTWDYDPNFGNEAFGWVKNTELSSNAKKQLHWISESFKLPTDFILKFDQATEELIQAHVGKSTNCLWNNFNVAAINKNYAHVSEFASYHYLRGVNLSKINSLNWNEKNVGMIEIARNLFLKLFRGGSIERYDLAYLWCDLVVPIEYCAVKNANKEPWLEQLLTNIESLPPKAGLKNLIACCKGLVGGNKYFKQEVLQSLAYADVIRVNELPVTDMFIAERRDDLSPHFYSNEWTFPLRFWPVNGGSVNREVIYEIKTA